jgi:hypothetical protein
VGQLFICKKADQIKPMAHMTTACAIENEIVCVDPIHLFHRLVIVGERQSNLRECFAFELTPYPMSLFKNGIMRKPDKPSLYSEFATGLPAFKPSGLQYVVDGGYLLHKVRWQLLMDMRDILPLFSKFLYRYGPGVHVAFDGYSAGPTIKDHEHIRRSEKVRQVAVYRELDIDTKDIGLQEPFLANTANKSAFIVLLMHHLQHCGIFVHQAESDADTLIVKVALECAMENNSRSIAVIAEDTDIFVLLLHHRKSVMKPVYFISEAKKGRDGKMVGEKCFNIGEVQTKIGVDACDRILVIHALGGCDSTSAIFGHGKGTIYNKIKEDRSGLLHANCMTLQNRDATDKDVCETGIQIVINLYGGKVGDRLADLRYDAYCKMSLSRRFQPERLPPSESAAHMHMRRVHLQAVIWGSMNGTNIEPTKWGWECNRNSLTPIKVVGDVTPQAVLKFIRCNCHGNCSSSMCSCKKNGLHCVSACGHCHGTDCANTGVSSSGAIEGETDDEPETVDNTDIHLVEGHTQFLFDEEIDFFYEEEI